MGVPLAVGGVAVLLLVLLIAATRGSGGDAAGSVEPRVVTAEKRPFTATVPLPGTVDVNPGAPGAYMVTARVDPLALYRLPERPARATVKITGGPPEFQCADVGLATVPAMAGANDQGSSDAMGSLGVDEETGEVITPPSGSGRPVPAANETVVRCAVPPDVRVFPGLKAELVVTTAELPEAVVVPAGAVEPESAVTGHVTVVDDEENEQRRAVKVGPSNGLTVVITEGLAPGEKVLDRVPIQDPAVAGQGGGSVHLR